MDKKLIGQIIVVAVVLLFIFSSFGPGGWQPASPVVGGENISGSILFNGTIRTYEPIIGISGNISQSVIDELRVTEGVMNIRPGQEGYIIDTETRDDVYPIAALLRSKNVSCVSVANIAAPSVMRLQFATKTLNVTSSGLVKVLTEPLVDAGETVTVSMVGISKNNLLIDYHSAFIVLQEVQLQLDGKVESVNSKTYIYEIPWEERNSVGNMTEYGKAEYRKIDAMLFDPPLDVNQIVSKKYLSYITYIDSSSAQVLPSFTNKTQVLSDFENVSVVLPSSLLRISTNQSIDLPYEGTVQYSYTLRLNDPPGYNLTEKLITITSDKEFNETFVLEVDALASGKKIVSVSLPS